jgi:hypothetical protein
VLLPIPSCKRGRVHTQQSTELTASILQISTGYVGLYFLCIGHRSSYSLTPNISVKTRVQAESDAKKLHDARELPSPSVKRNGAPRKLTSSQRVKVRDVIRHVWNEGVSLSCCSLSGAPLEL